MSGEGVRAVLCCAGRVPDRKWGDYLGVPKHLAPVDDAPLLARTIAQVRRYTTDVVITAPPGDDRYQLPGASTVAPDPAAADEYTGSRPWWNERGRTVLMLGDVYFTDAAIAGIFGFTGVVPRWFGRFGPSRVTASRWGEIFAVSWWPRHHSMLDAHLRHVHRTVAVTRPPGWKLYRSWHRVPMARHRRAGDWTEIDDGTDDFDVPDTYLRHPAIRGDAGHGLHRPGRR